MSKFSLSTINRSIKFDWVDNITSAPKFFFKKISELYFIPKLLGERKEKKVPLNQDCPKKPCLASHGSESF